MIGEILFILSIGLQSAVAIYALMLMRLTGRRLAWALISAGMILMTARRGVSFVSMLLSGKGVIFDLPELVALVISCLMLGGVMLIRNYFLTCNLAEEKQRQAEDVERKYRNLFNDCADGVYRTDKEGVFTMINKAGAEYLGYKSPEEVIGRHASEFWFNPADRETFVRELREKKHVRSFYAAGRRSTGEMTRSELTSWIVEDEGGNFLGIEGIIRDITERKRLEESLNEQKVFTERLMDNLAVAAFVVDLNHHITLWNKACEELTGFSAQGMIGTDDQWKPFYEYKRPVLADILLEGELNKLPELYSIYAKSALSPNAMRAEGWYRNLNGRDRYILFDAAPVYDSGGTLVGAVETLQDITGRKEAEEEIKQRMGDLEKFYNMAVDRELKMKEMKEEIKTLSDELLRRKKEPDERA